jgi:hypothetical protein
VLNEVPLFETNKKNKLKKKLQANNFEIGWSNFLTFESHVKMAPQSIFGKEDCCFVDKYKLFNLVLEFYSRSA